MSLEEIRNRINALDDAIVRLLDERAQAGRAAAAFKAGLGLPLHDPKREAEIVRRLSGRDNPALPPESLAAIYRRIMAETLKLEYAGTAAGGENPPRARCGETHSGKMDVAARIVENEAVAPGFHRIRLEVPALAGAFQPGQFFQLRCAAERGGSFLRRPFAPSETGPDGFAFVFALAGRGTKLLASLPVGTETAILAPLGNAFTLLPAGASALLLGGGCGAPSLAPLAARLRADGVRTTVCVGARNADTLLECGLFAASADCLALATDDGGRGCKGTVIDAFRREAEKGTTPPDRIYACGPLPMLAAAAKLAAELGVDCEVSLEERMACGFGVCMGCAVPVCDAGAEGGFVYRRVCHEGPVFKADTLCWERMRR